MLSSPPTSFPVNPEHVSLILHAPYGPQCFLSVLIYEALAHGGSERVCSL